MPKKEEDKKTAEITSRPLDAFFHKKPIPKEAECKCRLPLTLFYN